MASKQMLQVICALLLMMKFSSSWAESCSALESSGEVANLNELVIPGASGNVKYIETIILATGNTNTAGWELCTKAGNKVKCVEFGNGDLKINGGNDDNNDTSHPEGTYLTYDTNLNGDEGEVVLFDASGDVLDYIHYCKASCNSSTEWSVPASCGTTASDIGNQAILARYPEDGDGDWTSSNDPDGPTEPTEGDSNDGGGGGSSCTLGSFSVVQASNALACPDTRASVAITALCADGTTTKEDYTGTINLTASNSGTLYDAISGGNIAPSYTFVAGDLGYKELYLYKGDTGSSAVTVTDNAGGGETGTGNASAFYAYGFKVSTPTTMICGETQTLTLTAYGKSQNGTGQACEVLSNFNSNSVSVKAWYRINTDPDEATSAATVDNVPSAVLLNGASVSNHSEPATSNLTLDFSAGGTASLTLGYLDVGEVLDINFKHDSSPYNGSINDGNGNAIGPLLATTGASFVVKPDRIALSIADANWSCPSQDVNCTKFKKAGDSFNLTTAAICADVGNSTATQYSTGSGNIALTSSLVEPSGSPASLGVTTVQFDGSEGGTQTLTQTVSDVGVYDLIATPPSYFGQSVTAATLADVGRFYPDYLTITDLSITPACGSFSYMEQPFSLNYRIKSHAVGGAPTRNYMGGFENIGSSSGMITLGALSAAGDDLSTRLVPENGGLVVTDTTFGAWDQLGVEGESLVTSSVKLVRSATLKPDGAFSALQIGVLLSDQDGISLRTADLNLDPDGNGSNDSVNLGVADLRYGRMALNNAYGIEDAPLDIHLQTEYFNGTFFQTNTDDSCTTINSTDFGFTNFTKNLVSGETTLSLTDAGGLAIPADINLLAGTDHSGANIALSAPGNGNDGSVDITLSTDNWLKYDWNQDGSDDNPTATATFGRYRGHDRVIFRLEN